MIPIFKVVSMRKYSRQRELILNYLKGTTAHPTAEQIYADLKPENPALSLSTIYRNLNLLSEYGVIQKLTTGEHGDRFDADTREHSHFICSGCHQVMDVFSSLLDEKELVKALGDNCEVLQHKLYLYGVCSACNAGKKEIN